MLSMFKKLWSKIKTLFKSPEPETKEDIPLYLPCNGLYIAWIESIERQIEQVKIDYALNTITKEVYDMHFELFQEEVKRLSASYARQLLLYEA